jgi:hypothetical protein
MAGSLVMVGEFRRNECANDDGMFRCYDCIDYSDSGDTAYLDVSDPQSAPVCTYCKHRDMLHSAHVAAYKKAEHEREEAEYLASL